MPIYEYECRQCGKVEEAIQKFSDKPLTTCKRCSGELSKLVSQSSFHLKGAGWFADGYSDKSANKNATPKEESSSAGAAPEKAADSGTKENT
ncbi:MAG: zinc ribbon domain-containing protein [Pseudomonadota bacterium]